MSRFGFAALLAALGIVGWAGIAAPAQAANADVDVTVTRIPETVSVQRPGSDTYAAYTVVIKNNTGNVINNVTFSGSTSVPGSSDPAPQSAWVETIQAKPYCTHGANSVQCAIGQLRGSSDATGSQADFLVIFKAPATGTTLDFVWTASFSSGNSPNSPPADFQSFSGTASTGLVTNTDSTIRQSFITSVPTVGGTFCTGFNCLPSTVDEGSTKVKVPTRPTGDGIATVVEGSSGEVCGGGFACVTSAITIPGVFDNLVVTLTRAGAYVASNAKIASTKIYYTPDGNTFSATNDVVGTCVGFGTLNPSPPAGATDRPCIAFRTQYPNNYKPEPALNGAMQWILYSRHNGLMRF
jgi:hypothetical protein